MQQRAILKRRRFLATAGATMALAACAGSPRSPVDAANAEAAYPPLGKLYGPPGRRIHATDEGAGDGPPVIMIHGASGNVRDWTFDIAPMLAAGRRVIAMDRPGFGYSERPHDEYAWTPYAQAAQLREAAGLMGAKRPILVGHSWGASVALAWAQMAPDDVSGVVSVSGVTMPWRGVAPVLDSLGFGPVIAAAYHRRLVSTAEEGGVERFIDRAFRPQAPPEGYLDYVGAPLALREKTLAANSADLANTQRGVKLVAAGYANLKPPIEILHGDADWLLDVEQHALAFAETAPNARLTILPGVGHMAHHADAGALNGLVRRLS